MQPSNPLQGWGRALGGLFIGLPVLLYRLVRGETWAIQNLPTQRRVGVSSDLRELRDLQARLLPHAKEAEKARKEFCQRVVQQAFAHIPEQPNSPVLHASAQLIAALVENEGLFVIPEVDFSRKLSVVEVWDLTAAVRRQLALFENPDSRLRLEEALERILGSLLPERLTQTPYNEAEASAFVPIYALLPDPVHSVEMVLESVLGTPVGQSPFPLHWKRLEYNLLTISVIDPNQEPTKEPIRPSESKMEPLQAIEAYLAGTPFVDFFQTPIPFAIPLQARFEHTHIVAGTGHGKTQALESFILSDLDKLREGKCSVIVIDSQGDLLKDIIAVDDITYLSDRLVIIDPNAIEHPPALNLFDFGLDRINQYTPLEREKLLNGAVALYEYLFGALLGAELTQRQGVIFRYLARLMMVVPGATIHTLMDFMQEPETVRPHIEKLEPLSARFFKTQFFSLSYNDTRQQILTRLWGVVEKDVFARMFGNPKNKLNLFEAMNQGSLILINTAKDLLQQEGCEILGRFFIALICQAAQERSSIRPEHRRSTFVYIDEAHDYFDESIENLLNQARKYKVGIVLAHQNLDQFEPKLRSTVMSSTSIKMAGGLSASDASAFAKEMNCDPEYLKSMRKRQGYTQFACFVRNYTERPVTLTVPFGQMDARPRLSPNALVAILERNRQRYCAEPSGVDPGSTPSDGGPDEPEML